MNTDVNAQRPYRDRGTALLLTIAFVVMIGAIVGGLAGLVTSGLNNTVTLERLRDRQYAADGAIENAIADVRTAMGGSDPFDPCVAKTPKPAVLTELNQVKIRVDWRGACGVVQGAAGFVLLQRNVVFTACLDVGETCTAGMTIVSAQVNFEQGDTGPVQSTVIQSWSVDR